MQHTIGQRRIVLCIEETGDVKKGKATNYIANVLLGNSRQTANGIVSVKAYAVVDKLTYQLMFKIFKPKSRLKADDKYKTKPQLAIEILQEVKARGFEVELGLADTMQGRKWGSCQHQRAHGVVRHCCQPLPPRGFSRVRTASALQPLAGL